MSKYILSLDKDFEKLVMPLLPKEGYKNVQELAKELLRDWAKAKRGIQ